MKDIIMVLSDQHSAMALGDTNAAVMTPNLDELLKTSQVFTNAYCNNPICVPSRMSFLAGLAPNELGIYDNDTVLNSDIPTIADKLNDLGYKTMLVGRMHFKGEDQLHGFQERYVGDITTQWWGQKRDDLGAFKGTMQVSGCLNEVGFGDSPVQVYDKAVVDKAIQLLKKEHEKPLFMIIGLYGPHFPFCAYEKNFDTVVDKKLHLANYNDDCDSVYTDLQMETDIETLYNARKAYYGLVNLLDEYIKEIHDTVRKKDGESIFIYTSDHGEQLGHRKIFGKKTLYQESIRIPLIIEDLAKPAKKYTKAADLLDLHNTILKYAGKNVCDIYDSEKIVNISSIIEKEHQEVMLQAACWENYKLVKTKDYHLYDISKDLNEEQDILDSNPEIFEKLKNSLFDDTTIMKNRKKQQQLVRKLKEISKDKVDIVRFKIPTESTKKPQRRKHGEI